MTARPRFAPTFMKPLHTGKIIPSVREIRVCAKWC